MSTRRAPKKMHEVDADDDEFDRQFYLAEDDEYLPNSDAAGNGGDNVNATHGRFIFESERTRAREAEMQKKQEQGKGTKQYSVGVCAAPLLMPCPPKQNN